jgi:hypothetical protein
MKDFNFNKYIRHGFLLKENVDSENMTIELDMAWDNDAAAQEAFDKYRINVQGTGAAGTYEVSGKKEDILAYLRSDYYDMPMEDIAEFYPELLGDAEYTSDTDFDIYDQGDESDPIGGPLGEDDSEWQEGDEDMFNDWENIPPDVMAILDKYSEEEQSYQILQSLQDELEAIGYTFDWGLDAEPYGLRPMKK